MALSLLILFVAAVLVAVASWATAWHPINRDTVGNRVQATKLQDPAPRDVVTADR
jgi:hypothetical protein